MKILKKIAIIGYGGFAREIGCNFNKNVFSYFIHNKYINNQNNKFVLPFENIDINKYRVLIAIGDNKTRKYCENDRLALHNQLVRYVSILEKNPKALDYIKDVKLS